MPDSALHDDLLIALRLARAAADAAMAHYRPGLHVDFKDNDPFNMVTQADHDANRLITEGLAQAFPDDAVLAEETSASHAYPWRQDRRRVWCIDPIDGTREFVAHSGQFAVMIGLAIDGQARLGLVLQPTEETVYTGILGQDGRNTAWSQHGTSPQKPLTVSAIDQSQDARLVVSRNWHSKGIDAVAAHLGTSHQQPMGSVGLKMACLAQGRADVYISPSRKTHEWDACGPEAILRAAGGTVTDLWGQPLDYNKPTTPTAHGIVASNGHLHAACLTAVKAVARTLSSTDIGRMAPVK